MSAAWTAVVGAAMVVLCSMSPIRPSPPVVGFDTSAEGRVQFGFTHRRNASCSDHNRAATLGPKRRIVVGQACRSARVLQTSICSAIRKRVIYLDAEISDRALDLCVTDVAWTPEWVGIEQARSFKTDADQRQVMTP